MTPHVARELYGLTSGGSNPSTAPPNGTSRGHRCQACGSALIHRELGLVERWLLPLIGLRPYQCLDGGRRFWDRPRVGRGLAGIRKGAAPRPLPGVR